MLKHETILEKLFEGFDAAKVELPRLSQKQKNMILAPLEAHLSRKRIRISAPFNWREYANQ